MSILQNAEFNCARTPEGARRPDIFERLAADHRRLRFLLDRLCRGADTAPAQPRLFDLLCDALEGYAAAAEQSLYAEVLARAEADDRWPARHAVAVHDMAELLTFELSGMERGGDEWRAGLRQLSDYLEDHFRVEAEEIFPLAKTLIDRAAATRLGEKYEQEKRHWSDRFGRVPQAAHTAPAKHARAAKMFGTVSRSHNVTPPFAI